MREKNKTKPNKQTPAQYCVVYLTPIQAEREKKALLNALMALTSRFRQGIAAHKEAEDDKINTEVPKV